MDKLDPSTPPVGLTEIEQTWKALGSRLKQARRRRRLGTLELAERAGISRGTVIRAETETESVSLDVLGKMLVALGLPLEPIERLADPTTDSIGLSRDLERLKPKHRTVTDPRDQALFGDD